MWTSVILIPVSGKSASLGMYFDLEVTSEWYVFVTSSAGRSKAEMGGLFGKILRKKGRMVGRHEAMKTIQTSTLYHC
jgi:hypothetical protein